MPSVQLIKLAGLGQVDLNSWKMVAFFWHAWLLSQHVPFHNYQGGTNTYFIHTHQDKKWRVAIKK